MSNLYVPRLRAHKLSAAVGSGKTRAAIAWIADPKNTRRNVLYVAPTLALVEQTARDLRKALEQAQGGAVRNVHAVHSAAADVGEGQVTQAALQALDEVAEGDGRVLLLTTTTFLHCVAKVRNPQHWVVILDEAFKPVEFDQLSLGLDALEGWAHLGELFQVDPAQGHRLLPREGRKGLVEEVAAGQYGAAGDRFKAYEKAARYVANPAMRCELVMTDGAKALLEGKSPNKRRQRADGREQGTVLQFAYYVDPQAFAGFQEVLFLSALFEQTILYLLWTRALGVSFTEHPEFPSHLLRDTHQEQGRFLAVGHLLHKDDHASLVNLGRNAYTGQPNETRKGARVIDHAIQAAALSFNGERFLLQTNQRYGYTKGAPCLPAGAVWIPPVAHGMNDFQDVDNVAALVVTNPTPQEVEWVVTRTGVTSAQVSQAYRIHSIYQALGRCSIRKAERSVTPKVALVMGKADAEFIRDLFPGSHWLGQVGGLPSLATILRQGDTTPKEPGKEESLAVVIKARLGRIPESQCKVSSRALKATVEADQLALETGHLLSKTSSADVSFQGIDPKLWQRALRRAILESGGWQLQGSSLHRLTAEHYGFTSEEPALAA